MNRTTSTLSRITRLRSIWPGARAFGPRLPLALLLACALLALPLASTALEQEGVNVGGNSAFTKLVPADAVEKSAGQQYAQMLQQAASKNALAPADNQQLKRLRGIAQRLIPFAIAWNDRAKQWQWEVNLIGSTQINAFCMPGGKIAFYSGILKQLKLTDDEAAMVMGHEIAHALREHARERMGKNAATGMGANLIGQIFGLGAIGQTVTNYGAQLLTLEFSRSDESEADLVGMELAARAGFDPRAGVTLWQKMGAANKNAPPQWLSTHPAGSTRIADIEANLPRVMPLYERAKK
ncbi:peptidase M48 [Rhodoferax lacus]|uniref:Peptidase M48 n=1 Tax=Rhodoferax lacus TaxID=2184758 RepID=A0A3E1R727_9BURK|nr:M48 family metallopeptidase [Rhodoferax lacus]RFO95169.1 peptidase M48 [Rhodoferax lacus]